MPGMGRALQIKFPDDHRCVPRCPSAPITCHSRFHRCSCRCPEHDPHRLLSSIPGHRPSWGNSLGEVALSEPPARLLLRITFRVLWVFDGLLQAQGSMPLGLPGTVLTPASCPRVGSSTSSTWAPPSGRITRCQRLQRPYGFKLVLASSCSSPQGGPGHGWLVRSAPAGVSSHAAMFYLVAGVLLALAESAWEVPTLGKRLLRVMGAFFIGMGVLQAWPGLVGDSGVDRRTPVRHPGLSLRWRNRWPKFPILPSSHRWSGPLDRSMPRTGGRSTWLQCSASWGSDCVS